MPYTLLLVCASAVGLCPNNRRQDKRAHFKFRVTSFKGGLYHSLASPLDLSSPLALLPFTGGWGASSIWSALNRWVQPPPSLHLGWRPCSLPPPMKPSPSSTPFLHRMVSFSWIFPTPTSTCLVFPQAHTSPRVVSRLEHKVSIWKREDVVSAPTAHEVRAPNLSQHGQQQEVSGARLRTLQRSRNKLQGISILTAAKDHNSIFAKIIFKTGNSEGQF